MHRLAALLCVLLGIGAISGSSQLPGAEALGGVQGWWTARSYEQAALDNDWLQMGRLDQRLLDQTGNAQPLQLAAYRFGLDGTARTQGQVDAEVLAWAALFQQSLISLRDFSPDPWTDAHLQAHVLVTRVQPVQPSESNLELGLRAYEWWLAAGGGPNRQQSGPAQAYRDLLALPKESQKDEIRRMIDQ